MKNMIKALIAFLAVLVVCVLALSAFSSSKFKTELNTAKISWLPPEAENVSRKSRSGFGWIEFIECTIPEAQFRILASQKGWALVEIKDKHVYGRIEGLPPLRVHRDFGPVDLIQNGLSSESRAPNGGGYTVWYDRDLERMIYNSSHR